MPLLAAGLAACDGGTLLRDNYLGQGIIEPDLRPQRVRRDNLGNPILPTNAPSGGVFWRRPVE
jgi:hypothetical protein